MRESEVETILGAAVIAVAALFLFFAVGSSGRAASSSDRYEVIARFNSIAGIDRGSDVRVAGVKVGVVTDVKLDPARYEAVLRMSLDNSVELPDDSDARISSESLLGGSFVSIEPGGGFVTIAKDGTGEIIYTRGSVDLLTLFASFASGNGGGDN